MRGRGDWCSALGACHFFELSRHGEAWGKRLRLIAWKRLFLRFTFGLDGGLESEPRSLLPGHTLDWNMFGSLCLRRSRTFEREDNVANFNLVALLHVDFFDDSADRGGYFDHRFIGFKFHHRLAFGNLEARRNHEPDEIALGDVFSEFGQFEFGGTRGRRADNAPLSLDYCRSGLRRWFDRACFSGRSCRSSLLCFGFLRGRGRPRYATRAVLEGEDHLPNFDLLAFFNANLFHHAAYGGWHFDDGLVGFQFHHSLALRDGRAGRNHQADEVPLVDVFAEFR